MSKARAALEYIAKADAAGSFEAELKAVVFVVLAGGHVGSPPTS